MSQIRWKVQADTCRECFYLENESYAMAGDFASTKSCSAE